MLNRREAILTFAGVFAPPQKINLQDQKGEKISVQFGNQKLFDYSYSSSRPKTYVHPLYLPDGSPITRDGPPGHVHHRGVMLAWSDVNGFDFWGETTPGKHGRITHERFLTPYVSDTIDEELHWWTPDSRVLIVERRKLRPLLPKPEYVWFDWHSRLEATEKPVTLSAKGHPYNGLGIRVIEEMDGGNVLNSNGTTTIEKANGEPARWCAYYGKGPGGKGSTCVAIFDYPRNPRHPTPFFVMKKDFGYLGAAPTFHEETLLLTPGKPVNFRWAVVALAGEPNAKLLDRMYKDWSAEV